MWMGGSRIGRAYVEVNVEVSRSAVLTVADLERHRHFVILVQFLVETFSRVCFQLDIVCQRGPY